MTEAEETTDRQKRFLAFTHTLALSHAHLHDHNVYMSTTFTFD